MWAWILVSHLKQRTFSEGRTCTVERTYKKVKQSRNRPGVAQSVPGDLGSQISMTFGIWRWWGCEPHAPAAFTPRKFSWYSFSLGAGSTPGPWNGRKEYVTEKSSDNTGNCSRDSPTSSAAQEEHIPKVFYMWVWILVSHHRGRTCTGSSTHTVGILCEFGSWCLTRREEHVLKTLQYKLIWRMCGPKRWTVTVMWRKLGRT